MNKIVNGAANDYEFPNMYGPNISYSKLYVEQVISEKDKEIERLNKELSQEKKDFKEVNDYAFKLKNIIDELEKWLEEQSLYEFPNIVGYYRLVVHKLKELKEESYNGKDNESTSK